MKGRPSISFLLCLILLVLGYTGNAQDHPGTKSYRSAVSADLLHWQKEAFEIQAHHPHETAFTQIHTLTGMGSGNLKQDWGHKIVETLAALRSMDLLNGRYGVPPPIGIKAYIDQIYPSHNFW